MHSLNHIKEIRAGEKKGNQSGASQALVQQFLRSFQESRLPKILSEEGFSQTGIEAHKNKLLETVILKPVAFGVLSKPAGVEALSAFVRSKESCDNGDPVEISKGPLSPSFQKKVGEAWAAFPEPFRRFLSEDNYKICAAQTISSYILDESSLFFEADCTAERIRKVDENLGYYEAFVNCAIIPEFYRSPSARSICQPGAPLQEEDVLSGDWFAAEDVPHTVRHESAHAVDCNAERYIGNALSRSEAFQYAVKADLFNGRYAKEKEFYVRLTPRERAMELWADHLAAVTNKEGPETYGPRVWPQTFASVRAFYDAFTSAEEKGLSSLMLFLKTKKTSGAAPEFLFHTRWLDLLRRSSRTNASDVFDWMKDAGPSRVFECLSRLEKDTQTKPNDGVLFGTLQTQKISLSEPLRAKAACALSAASPNLG